MPYFPQTPSEQPPFPVSPERTVSPSSSPPPGRSPDPFGSPAQPPSDPSPPGDLAELWGLIDAELSSAVDDPAYRIWLAPLSPVCLDADHLTIAAPPRISSWVRERFGRLLQTAVAAVLGPQVTVDLVADLGGRPGANAGAGAGRLGRQRDGHPRGGAGVGSGSGSAASAYATAGGGGFGTETSATPVVEPTPLTNPKLTFQQFVIGDSNRLAHAAALTVAEMPAHAYNPLFICGPPGVGKTHLLRSIHALLLAHDPTLTVRCLTGEQFTADFMAALGDRATGGFKAHLRAADVLLIDDIQFLERKSRTEEEFFHTFNALYDAGSQIVLTSDRPPHDLDALEDRLRERFQAGLVADIHPPDRATRLAILRKRVLTDRIDLADDRVLDTLADHITINVRALEGALIRTVAFGSLTGRSLTRELAAEVLSSLYPGHDGPAASASRRRSSIADIQAAACRHFGVSTEELLSSARTKRIALPRHIAMYLARELTDESLPSIGRSFGGRDHSTVLHACKRTAELIGADERTRTAVESLRRSLTG